MAEHQLTAIDVEVNEETPYFFQRIGELAFDRTKSPEYAKESARKRQRECIAAAPHYGVAAIAGEEGNITVQVYFRNLAGSLELFGHHMTPQSQCILSMVWYVQLYTSQEQSS